MRGGIIYRLLWRGIAFIYICRPIAVFVRRRRLSNGGTSIVNGIWRRQK